MNLGIRVWRDEKVLDTKTRDGFIFVFTKRFGWESTGVRIIKEQITNLNELRDYVHRAARDKGFYDDDHRTVGDHAALIHTEVSEFFECWRDGETELELVGDDGKPIGMPSELADIMIRVLDCAGHLGIDIDKAIGEKLRYNTGRPYRHRGKRA